MLSAQTLSANDLKVLRIPASLRSEEEVVAPLKDRTNALSSLFQVDNLEFVHTKVEGEGSGGGADLKELASLHRCRVESVWGGVLKNQLVENGHKDAESAMTTVWDEYEQMVRDDPALGWLFMQCYYLQLTKL